MRVVVLANDVVPGMGLPVAAPGIRAWGLALGLRAHGHEVTVVVDQWIVGQVWQRPEPPPLPRGTVLLLPKHVGRFARTHGVDAVVISNSNHAEALGDLGDARLVYDFFAPKVLELRQNTARADLAEAVTRLEQRKLRALGSSDAVIVNGAKKLPYATEWVERSGRDGVPMAVVNPGLPPVDPDPWDDGALHVVVSGYLQPWSRPGAWAEAVLPLLDSGRLRLHLMVGRHWGQRVTTEETPSELVRLADHPASTRHGLLRLGDFRRLLARCHLSLDVFARNPERELAMVTRSVVALSCGLPVLHVPFTEVGPWIADHGAGWLVAEDDVAAMTEVLETAAGEGVAKQRAGAVGVAHDVLEPSVAAEPLHRILRDWS